MRHDSRSTENETGELPRPTDTSPASPPEKASDHSLLRLLGPDVGDLAAVSTEASEPVSLPTLDRWIDGAGEDTRLSVLELFVNLHRSNTTLRRRQPADTVLAWASPTLQLPAPTHSLLCRCDCSAPNARVDLYVHAPRHTSTGLLTPPLPQGHDTFSLPGWHVATDTLSTAFDQHVTMPLVLDGQWHDTNGALLISITIEALDEDGCPLEQRNACTTQWETSCVADTPDAWQIRLHSQHARIGPFSLRMHELFGFDAHTEQPLAPPPEIVSESSPAPPLALNENLVHSAALLTEDLREDGSECPICMSEATSTLLFPCTHALCLECAVRVRDSVQKSRTQDREHGRAPRREYACPLCRRIIESMLSLTY
ncbi:hypothetical protein MNAN1_001048 [Malassezia nana]|uniref:RING-type domain-containing protein n=1 Tax=Malassezia nana TaxID=180528 RepID=A0AAF0EKK1_9BASI|nr:hypothetical protein MNAN1_001048 [Malassezia nana]